MFKHFKKTILVFIISSFLIFPVSASAQLNIGQQEGGLLQKAGGQAGYAQATQTTFAETLGAVVKTVMSFAGVVFLSLMVYAGYLWMTAHGQEDQISKAQRIIRNSIIGLIIAVGAYSITNFIVPRILEKTTGDSGTIGGASVGLCEWAGGSSRGSDSNIVESSCLGWCQGKAQALGVSLDSCRFNGQSI